MAFVNHKPNFEKISINLVTQNRVELQLWQQIKILRHITPTKGLPDQREMNPWLDQAESYYKDALVANWRTAGLLYYYSFLNLAKAYLIGSHRYPTEKIKSSSIYHGLAADPQVITNITDYKVKIMPPVANGKANIFASFYEEITGCSWPFTTQITVRVGDILSYCGSIGSEINEFYGIKTSAIPCLGLLREDETTSWYEICVESTRANDFLGQFPPGIFNVISGTSQTSFDRTDWFEAHRIPSSQIGKLSLIQTQKIHFTESTRVQVVRSNHEIISDLLKDFIAPLPQIQSNEHWHFFQKIEINDTKLKWRPIFSDYILAFVLSTILRYQPHLFEHDNKDSYIAQAWCAQSSIDALRYFVMNFTDPMIILN